MRFASRDLVSVKLLKRIEPTSKRIDEEESFDKGIFIWAVIRPVKSSLVSARYGERITSMKQILSMEAFEIGSRIEYMGQSYKIIEADRWTEHYEGIIELCKN